MGSEHRLPGNASSAFAVTCHVAASCFMSSSSSIALGRRLGLFCSFSSLLLPAEVFAQALAQSAPPTRLDPIEVSPSITAKPKPAAPSSAAGAARPRARRAAAAATGGEVRPAAASASVSPTLNATKPAGTGSRLGLTPLQTPASVEIITAETIAERGQHNVTDAVIQNATGFTALSAPGNGSLSFSDRGFAGSNSVMTLDRKSVV